MDARNPEYFVLIEGKDGLVSYNGNIGYDTQQLAIEAVDKVLTMSGSYTALAIIVHKVLVGTRSVKFQ